MNRNCDNSRLDFLRRERYAPVPVSRKKTGAQKCVIQRVKNSGMVVWAGSVGLKPVLPKKSRVVIERHEDHDYTANDINGFEADAFRRDGFGYRHAGIVLGCH